MSARDELRALIDTLSDEDAETALASLRRLTGGAAARRGRQLTVGCPVYTEDEEKLGEIKELQGRFFKIDARFKPDFWLDVACIGAASERRVTLNLTDDEVVDFKLAEPSIGH
jgi:hypothetical protein